MIKKKAKRKPPNVKRRKRLSLVTRGKFLTVRELVYTVHLLRRNGCRVEDIARECCINQRTAIKILNDPPDEAFPDSIAPEPLYAIVSERALPESIKPDDYPFAPLQGPWLHGSRVDDARLLAVKDRVLQMGTEHGTIDVYRLEKVDLAELVEVKRYEIVAEPPSSIELISD